MLNKQGPGKIDWTDYTWNPISGCLHSCDYCYMRRMQKRFKDIMIPAFHTQRLDDIKPYLKPSNIKIDPGGNDFSRPTNIFVGSSGDMWGEWVSKDWINSVLSIIENYPQHRFQFLTKNPERYKEFSLPKNGIYGTTMDGTKKTEWNMAKLLYSTEKHSNLKVFISFEPLLKRIPISAYLEDFEFLNWMIIGANSSRGAKKPPLHWAGALIALAKEFNIPVFVKDNYFYPERFKEMPK